MLREHFPQTARSHREEILPPDLEEIHEPRHLVQEEDEDDETETARPFSEREKRELFRQHRKLGHPQRTELTRALRHEGARREAVLKELRCPACEAQPLPLPPRPGMLPRCLRFNQCIGVDLVDLEVRAGTSAKALNVVWWGTGLQIVQPLWTNYTAKTVMKEFKIALVKHYGWPEIIVHEQGPEFIGKDFQNPAGAAGVLTMPIDSQSPWQNGKTERAGQSFKHQLWDLDEECHIEGETVFGTAVAECCDARNRYCNRSGFSAHQRVFGYCLRLPESLLSDEPRHLVQEEDEDDETETARLLSEREKRELFRQHRYLGHPQRTELARALRHAGARREAVLKELRCPTCEARPLPLPPRPGMLPRCLRFNQCIGVDLVDLEVRAGTAAKALNVVCWGTGLQIVQPLWTNYTAKTVMKEFKIAWVKHYGWPEIIVHEQGPEFIGKEFQNPAGAAGVLTMPIDSQSPWQNGKTERAGQSFKHQLWDLDEECHIEGETVFGTAVAECCDARNRYCNRSGFSAHQRVFGYCLRLLGGLLSDDPIDRQLLTAVPYTNFHRANEMRTAAQRSLFKQNSARAVQAAGLARHRSQLRENINAGDTTMVWRNNNLTGGKGWT